MRNKILIIGVLFLLSNIAFSILFGIQYRYYIWSDAEGYYQYLPYLFIKNDIPHQAYAYYLDNGMTMNKYTFGVAILEMPFFLVAHAYSVFRGLQSDGVTPVYGFSLMVGASFYVYIGLVLLYKILIKKFNTLITLLALATIYFGSNLFYYTICESGLSHAYSFFVLSWFLFRLEFFFKSPKFKSALLCSIPLALSMLIRPTNIIYILLFLLYYVDSFYTLKVRVQFIRKNFKYFILFAIVGFLVFFPQFYYWWFVTGKIVIYSYVNPQGEAETFKYITNPKLVEVLFGVESGWLIYSPIFLFFVIGMILSAFKKSFYFFAILAVFLIIFYINASWWAYTYACSFGYRSFIEYYPLFIIPITYFFSKMFGPQKKYFQKTIIGFLIVIFAFTNIRLSLLYYNEKCWERPSWTWTKFNKALNKAFYLIPQNRHLK